MRCGKTPSACGYSKISNPRLNIVASCKCIAWSSVRVQLFAGALLRVLAHQRLIATHSNLALPPQL